MTAHELARALLEMPDVEVVYPRNYENELVEYVTLTNGGEIVLE